MVYIYCTSCILIDVTQKSLVAIIVLLYSRCCCTSQYSWWQVCRREKKKTCIELSLQGEILQYQYNCFLSYCNDDSVGDVSEKFWFESSNNKMQKFECCLIASLCCQHTLLKMESGALLTINLKLRSLSEALEWLQRKHSGSGKQWCSHYCLPFSHWDFNHRLQYFWLMCMREFGSVWIMCTHIYPGTRGVVIHLCN